MANATEKKAAAPRHSGADNSPQFEPSRLASSLVLVASCVLFFACGLALLPYPGVQNDEALFAAPLYQPKWDLAHITLFHVRISLMLMSYLGCLKSWIYKPIFLLWPPSVYSLRVPVLLMGTITIYLTWLLLRRTLGNLPAIMGVILLATDTSFLLTTCFDWGPVVLQHLLMVSGVLALTCFHQSGNEKLLALGFFLFGLGVWDKALFSWTLAGLTVATLVVFPRELWKDLSYRRLLLAGSFFVLGAFPLLWYNVGQGGSTLRSNTHLSFQNFDTKLDALKSTTEGSAFFGYIVSGTHSPPLRRPQTVLQRSSVWLSQVAGERHRNLMVYAFVAALLLVPALWRTAARKPILFSLVFLVVIWLQMTLTYGAGTGAHHVILMWPWPMLFMAAAFSQVSFWFRGKGAIAVIVVVLSLLSANLLLTNEYLKQLIQVGPAKLWSDAVFPLAEYLGRQTKTDIYSVDWGMTNSLRLLDRGTLRLQEATFVLLKEAPDQYDRQFLTRMITNKDRLLVAHTTPFEAFAGINARLATLAAGLGYQPRPFAVINDRESRPVFVVFRFEKISRGFEDGLRRGAYRDRDKP